MHDKSHTRQINKDDKEMVTGQSHGRKTTIDADSLELVKSLFEVIFISKTPQKSYNS